MVLLSTAAALLALVLSASANPSRKPNHGARKVFDFTLTWEDYTPDGFTRKMLLVNGKSPGPVLEVNEGDTVVVHLHNAAPRNTSMHFHGIEQHGTPWADGVPGVSQRPIQPGSTFTYEWTATQHGSYWYHAHSRGEIEDGFYGPIIIHPSKSRLKPFELISNNKKTVKALEKAEKSVHPLLITDFTHLTSQEKWDTTLEAKIEDSCYDSILFNGKGRVECLDPELVAASVTPVQQQYLGIINGTMTDKSCLPAAALDAITGGVGDPDVWPEGVFYGCTPTKGSLETITVRSKPSAAGNWIAIDLIGGLNFMTTVVSIDEHDMWVYAMDGSYVNPQKVQALILSNGERYSVFVHTTKPGKYKIRAISNSVPQIIAGHAILAVKGPGGSCSKDAPYIDIVGNPVGEDVVLFDQNTAAPFPPEPIAKTAKALYRLDMFADGASYLWTMNSSRLMPDQLDDRNPPTLYEPTPYVQNNVTITTENDTWIDLVFYAAAFPMPPHPIHKHGNKMYQIGAGAGDWTWASVEEAMAELPANFNLANPPRRDGFASPPAIEGRAWTVVRYHVTNPGAWLLHCHINNHMIGGMMVVIQDGIDAWPTVPEQYRFGGS